MLPALALQSHGVLTIPQHGTLPVSRPLALVSQLPGVYFHILLLTKNLQPKCRLFSKPLLTLCMRINCLLFVGFSLHYVYASL